LGAGRSGAKTRYGHRHDAHPRVAVGRAEGAELLDVRSLAGAAAPDAGLALEPAGRGVVEVLLRQHEAARQREVAAEGVRVALDQQHRQPPVGDREDDDVDRDAERREGPGS
jgi:hypothetical protein